MHLPDHLVWPITLSQAERTGKVTDEQWFLFNRRQESLVYGLLVCGTAA